MWDLWWEKWHWGRFYFGLPCQFWFHRLLHAPHHPLSGAGTTSHIVADMPNVHSHTITPSTIKAREIDQNVIVYRLERWLGRTVLMTCWGTRNSLAVKENLKLILSVFVYWRTVAITKIVASQVGESVSLLVVLNEDKEQKWFHSYLRYLLLWTAFWRNRSVISYFHRRYDK
jgi:hypothetical protein